jgi:multiple sugar transport system substrate-binding protein
MKKVMKKTIAMIMTTTMLAATLCGCSAKNGKNESKDANASTEETNTTSGNQTEEGSTSDEKQITLKFWHTYGDSEEAVFLNTVIPLWNEKHPNIKIDAVRQDSSNYHQMIVSGFGTGDIPDVARIDIVNTASYAEQGGLVALSDYSDFAEIKDTYLEAPLSTNYYQGSYYGLPLDTNCKAAVVNMNKMNEIGLKEIPETMEEFVEAAKTYGDYTLSVSGTGDWDLYPYFWLFGGTLTDDGYTKATGYLNSEESINAINTLIQLHNDKVLTIRDVDGTVDAWDGISSGDFAMFFEGPWYFGSYDDTASKNIYPGLIPSYNGRSASVVGGENIVVFSTSKNKDAAYEFSKFMTSEEVQLAMLTAGQLPVLKSMVDNKEITDNPVWSVYMKQMESAMARIPSPNHTAIGEIWSDTMANIFAYGKDVKTELDNAATLIDEQLQ